MRAAGYTVQEANPFLVEPPVLRTTRMTSPYVHRLQLMWRTMREEVLRRWEMVLHGLETDPMSLARQLDWVAKLRLLEAYRERHGCGWDDHRLAAMDLQYHDLRPERSLFARLDTEKLIDEQSVISAITEPPRNTRAWFRGQCLTKWPAEVVTANWDSLVFDLGTDPLRRVPMMDPLRGTADHVDELLQQSATPSELLDRLSS